MTEDLSLALPLRYTAGIEVDLPALVESYSATLFRVANSVLRSAPEAEDVVQDVFLRVLQHRRALPEVRDVRPWLVRIAWNLALDRRRRIRPEQMDPAQIAALQSPGVPADQALAQARRTSAVFLAIDRLPQPERQALLLTALEELSTVEIAHIMGRSESAVRALVFRARTRVRERLQKAGQA